jgi:hypothetical protein
MRLSNDIWSFLKKGLAPKRNYIFLYTVCQSKVEILKRLSISLSRAAIFGWHFSQSLEISPHNNDFCCKPLNGLQLSYNSNLSCPFRIFHVTLTTAFWPYDGCLFWKWLRQGVRTSRVLISALFGLDLWDNVIPQIVKNVHFCLLYQSINQSFNQSINQTINQSSECNVNLYVHFVSI